jgi:hypothetical protein
MPIVKLPLALTFSLSEPRVHVLPKFGGGTENGSTGGSCMIADVVGWDVGLMDVVISLFQGEIPSGFSSGASLAPA